MQTLARSTVPSEAHASPVSSALPSSPVVLLASVLVVLFAAGVFLRNRIKRSNGKAAVAPKPPRESHTELTELLTGDVCNMAKVANGGQLLSLIDIAGGIAAVKHSRAPCVTVSMDSIVFQSPARLHDIVRVRAAVTRAFNSSLEVKCVVSAEDHRTGAARE